MSKKLLHVLLSFAIILTLLLGTSLPAGASTFRTATAKVSVLNVRSGASTSFARITTVSSGTIMPVLAEQSGWVRVQLRDGKTGWVAAEHVTLRNFQPTQQARVTSALNLRVGPGTTFTRITTLSTGTIVPIIQRQGDWLQVRLTSGQIGWVLATYTVISAVSTTPPPVSAPAQPTQPLQQGTVNTSVLNVRSGPATTFSRITTVNQGTKLTILKTQADWLQVRLASGQTGWVSAPFVTIAQQATPAPPTPTPSPAPQPIPTPQPTPPPVPEPIVNPVTPPAEPVVRRVATMIVTSGVNVRTGPDTTFDRITILPLGADVDVIGEQGDWLQVQLSNGQIGWLASSLVSVRSFLEGDSADGTSSLAGKIIVLDPGHGGSNPGAVGVTGLWEQDVNIDVTLRLADKLRRAGAIVVLTRDAGTDNSLAGRVNIAQAVNADVFVSIHANAHPNPAIGGTETYYYAQRAGAAQSLTLASYLQSELVKSLGLRDIGVKNGNFHVIRETTMPAVLVELAFLSNATEEALMRTDQFRENSADAIFRGLERYFRISL